MSAPRVIIEVSGGVADVRCASGEVEVILVDWDAIKEGDGIYTQTVTAEPKFDAILREIQHEADRRQMNQPIPGEP